VVDPDPCARVGGFGQKLIEQVEQAVDSGLFVIAAERTISIGNTEG
jgi:hypothetical protein